MNDDTTTGLSELLDRLELKAAEDLATHTYTGHALSKTESALQLAIPTGILSVPFSEIKKVTPVFGMGPDWVSIVVGNADKATYLRRVSLRDAELANPSSGHTPHASVAEYYKAYSHAPLYAGGSVVQVCNDTATVTGGAPDATDDGECHMQVVDPGTGGI